MSEAAQANPKEEANKQYSILCMKAGDLQARMNSLHGQLNQVFQEIADLQQKHAASEQPKAEAPSNEAVPEKA